jgi:hypothetical protein
LPEIRWCYLLWYLVTVDHHFDPTPAIWVNSLGSVRGLASGQRDGWQTFRLFPPHQGQRFLPHFSAGRSELLISIGACLGFLLLAALLQRRANPKRMETTAPLGNGIGSVAG